MNIVFFGTPEFAREFLAALNADEDISVLGVVTQPDKPVGRKKILTAPPVKEFAIKNNIEAFQPEKLKDKDFQSKIRNLKPDAFVIVAYGMIIPQEVLDIPSLGNINVHPSKLPKYRGPSPMQATIAAGDAETAVSIMLIDEKMDHGPILAQTLIKIDKTETIETLQKKVVDVGAPLLIDSIKRFGAGDLEPKEQDYSQATFCKLLSKEDGKIDWSEPAEVIERKARAYTPWPGVWSVWNDKTIKFHQILISSENMEIEPGQVLIVDDRLLIGTGSLPIEVLELQLEGKQKTTAKNFIQGHKNINNEKLG